MRSLAQLCSLFILIPSLTIPGAEAQQSLDGFSASHSDSERKVEDVFRSHLKASNLRDSMQHLTAHPHHVGSPWNKANAEWLRDRFHEWGYDAQIETFDVLFPSPKDRLLEMVAPTHFTAHLAEPALTIDPTSAQTSEQLPTYNAYSIDGDVTGPLVYVNQGSREDYETLERMGISVKGAIVIARYGDAWRGIKPKVAAEHGAIGCIIYSDPKEDGFYEGDTYPGGSLRPKDGVQRGSVMDTDYPGDPLTPGVGSTKDAKRLALKDATTITRIPVLPISWGDAQPLLAALSGPVAPEEWRGGLPITYHIGSGPAKVHLRVTSNWDTKTIYNVIARLEGSEHPEQWILRGNHHDAWVNGASDPVSGLVAMMEEARGIGELARSGSRPRRSIVYTAWDGEEPGLLGSTEWVETHLDELQKHAVAYINSDNNERGFLRVKGSHSLEHLINGVARDVQDPEVAMSVWKRAQLRRIYQADSAEERSELRSREDLRIGALGDGSDYTAFLHHAGIASMDIRFFGEDDGGQYHSIYDDFYWYTHYSDTNFAFGRALAEAGGLAVLRLANADLIPFQYANAADTVHNYMDDLKKSVDKARGAIREQNRQIEEGVYVAIHDPQKTLIPPSIEEVPMYMNFAPLENALTQLEHGAARYDAARKKLQNSEGAGLESADLSTVNRMLMDMERHYTSVDGLPDRPWFRHQLYAPGAYTGYAAKPMAAIREAMDRKDWKAADQQIPRIAALLSDEATALEAAAAELEKLSK